jgi:hypothetical protein
MTDPSINSGHRNQKPEKRDDEEIIVRYTRDEAIADGTLTPVGFALSDTGRRVNLTFTTHLFEAFKDHEERFALLREGLTALAKPDAEDDGRRLRVLRDGTIWVIWDGDGITFLYPADY